MLPIIYFSSSSPASIGFQADFVSETATEEINAKSGGVVSFFHHVD
jgi:hypothetical protein